jgi:hypothetical protein
VPAGPPFKQLDARKIELMAEVGCSREEIGLLCGVSTSTIDRNYDGAVKQGHAKRNYNLRKLQYESAKRGSVAMLIWLGKQWLGQKEHIELAQADVLNELLSEYKKRYERLADTAADPQPAQPADPAQKPKRNHHRRHPKPPPPPPAQPGGA